MLNGTSDDSQVKPLFAETTVEQEEKAGVKENVKNIAKRKIEEARARYLQRQKDKDGGKKRKNT